MKKPHIELVYFPGCPNVEAAREALRTALSAEGLPSQWREWNRDDAATPTRLRHCASPTILVNGHDVQPTDNDGQACRVYATNKGLSGAPGIDTLRATIKRPEQDKHER